MKVYPVLLVTLVIILSGCTPEKVVNINPASPKIGDQLNLVYNPEAPGACLKGDSTVTAEILLVREGTASPLLTELSMVKEGKHFTATYKIADQKGVALLTQFVAGGKRDTLQESGRNFPVYGADGKPVKGALAVLGLVSSSGNYYGFRCKKDTLLARQQFREEQTLYPDDWDAYFNEWGMDLPRRAGDEQKAAVRKDIQAFLEKHKNNEEAVSGALRYLERADGKAQADSIKADFATKNPKGLIAEDTRLMAAYGEQDPQKRCDLMEAFMKDFPSEGDKLESWKTLLVSFQLAAKKYDAALATLDKIQSPTLSLSYRVSSALLDAGVHQEKALELAKQAVELAAKDTAPPYMRKKEWDEQYKYTLALMGKGYAKALLKCGRPAEAEKAFEDALATVSEDGDLYEGLISAYLSAKKYDKVLPVASKAIQASAASERLVADYRKAYIGLKGSEKGFEEVLSKDRAAAVEATKARILKERVNQPAGDFALKGLDGNTVRLSDLKGKVVVVDFWATWCGPCRMSFPSLQKIYEKYQSNPDVRILALDTWEDVTGKERENLVQKFMADNKYTFPVLFDEDIVTQYGVTGIPTKFIIDKKGLIQVKSVGFYNGPKMIDEMTVAIDMMLADDFYKN